MAPGGILRASPEAAFEEPAEGADAVAARHAVWPLQRLAVRAPADRRQPLQAAERRARPEARLRGAPADQPGAELGREPVGEGASRDRGPGGVCRGAARAARGSETGGAALEADAGRRDRAGGGAAVAAGTAQE